MKRRLNVRAHTWLLCGCALGCLLPRAQGVWHRLRGRPSSLLNCGAL